MSGYVKTFKDGSKENKLTRFCINNDKHLGN